MHSRAGVDLDDVLHLNGATAALDGVLEQSLGGLGHVLAAHALEGSGGIVLERILGGSLRGSRGGDGLHIGAGADSRSHIGNGLMRSLMAKHRTERHNHLPSLDLRIASEIKSSATSSTTPKSRASSDMAVEICELDWPSW